MNSIPGREPRADTRDINQPKETHKRGCYLALTFGTLLSSQGADAHETRPIPWPSFEAASLRYATFRGSQVPGSVTSGMPSRATTPSTTGGSQEAFPRPARLLGVRHPVRPAGSVLGARVALPRQLAEPGAQR